MAELAAPDGVQEPTPRRGDFIWRVPMTRQSVSPLLALAAAMGVFTLAACNTVAGAGQDVQNAGQAVEETAEDLNDGNPNTP